MSEFHVRIIRDWLDENFRSIIDLSDVKKHSQVEQDNHFRTRALAAFVVKAMTGIDSGDAARTVTDGTADNGVDAIYIQREPPTLYLVQSKWHNDGKKTVDVGDVHKFISGVNDILNLEFSSFNSKARMFESDIIEVLNNHKTRVVLLVTYPSTTPIPQPCDKLLNDFVCSKNDSTEFMEFRILKQEAIYSLMLSVLKGEPIEISVTLEKFGYIREPFLAYYGVVRARDIADWWERYYPQLLDRNLRGYLGNTESVNLGMTETISTEPAHFFYFNNGITAICDHIGQKPVMAGSQRQGVFDCKGFAIVNGAQTAGAIHSATRQYATELDDALVSLRIISLEKCPEEFRARVARYTNTQNRVEIRDFVAFDDNQERIRNELKFEGITYNYRRQELRRDTSQGFDLEEATIAQACAAEDVAYAVQAKREISKLWRDITKAPYLALFNNGVRGVTIWRRVRILREIEMALREWTGVRKGRDALIATHGNRLIANICFSMFDRDILSPERSFRDEEAQIVRDCARETTDQMCSVIKSRYTNDYYGSLFKNAEKCRILSDAIKKIKKSGIAGASQLDLFN